MATAKIKPNGQLIVSQDEAANFVSSIPIQKLPGVGRSTMEKLKVLKFRTCGELRQTKKAELKKLLGDGNGEKVYQHVRGEGSSDLSSKVSRIFSFAMLVLAHQESA